MRRKAADRSFVDAIFTSPPPVVSVRSSRNRESSASRDVAVTDKLKVSRVRELEYVFGSLHQRHEARRLIEHPPQSLAFGDRLSFRQDPLGGLVPLVEHADYGAVFPADWGETVVPVCLPHDAAAYHGQHLVEGGIALPG